MISFLLFPLFERLVWYFDIFPFLCTVRLTYCLSRRIHILAACLSSALFFHYENRNRLIAIISGPDFFLPDLRSLFYLPFANLLLREIKKGQTFRPVQPPSFGIYIPPTNFILNFLIHSRLLILLKKPAVILFQSLIKNLFIYDFFIGHIPPNYFYTIFNSSDYFRSHSFCYHITAY